MTECLVIIDVELLRVATNDTPSLVSCKRSVEVEFVFENPLADENISARRMGNKRSSVIFKEGVIVVNHGLTPVGILKGSLVCFWNWRN